MSFLLLMKTGEGKEKCTGTAFLCQSLAKYFILYPLSLRRKTTWTCQDLQASLRQGDEEWQTRNLFSFSASSKIILRPWQTDRTSSGETAAILSLPSAMEIEQNSSKTAVIALALWWGHPDKYRTQLITVSKSSFFSSSYDYSLFHQFYLSFLSHFHFTVIYWCGLRACRSLICCMYRYLRSKFRNSACGENHSFNNKPVHGMAPKQLSTCGWGVTGERNTFTQPVTHTPSSQPQGVTTPRGRSW